MTDALCTSCGGALVSRKQYRMSPVVVAAGMGGVVMSALAILAGLIMIFFGIDSLRAVFMEGMAAPRIEVLRVAGVPEDVIRKVADAETVTDADREGLDARQLELVAETQWRVEAIQAATASAANTARLNSIVVAVVGAITAALSLPLLSRKKVLLCADCGAADT
jgi:hypothetical protein